MKHNHILIRLKKELKNQGMTSLLIPRRDRFLGEYYPPDQNRLKQISGFSGSAGTALITQDKNILFVDSRYTLQAGHESDFEIVELTLSKQFYSVLKKNAGTVLGYDAKRTSYAGLEALKQNLDRKTELRSFDERILEKLFFSIPCQKSKIHIFEYPESLEGCSVAEKMNRIADLLKENELEAFYLSDPVDVSWLTNHRSDENGEFPVVFKTGFIDKTGNYTPFNNKLLSKFKGQSVGYDPVQTSVADFNLLTRLGIQMKPMKSFVSINRSVKTPAGIMAVRSAAEQDSIIFCRFWAWLEKNKMALTEAKCVDRLKKLRCQTPFYFADSFPSIVASGANGAMAHYIPDKKGAMIKKAPLLLVDTGAHYMGGTTDMTRTLAIDTPTCEMKRRYTQVLQGHIDFVTTVLNEGDPANLLDERARAPLKRDGVDYGHATGHGIGQFLGVHDAIPVISPNSTDKIEAGMVFSNEPGYYDAGNGFGIRLENMVCSVQNQTGHLILETMTLVPFDPRLIELELLDREQRHWLKEYHVRIKERIFPFLTKKEKQILSPMVDFFIEMD